MAVIISILATKSHCVWWISISPSDLTIIIESSIADRAIQFIGFTAGRGHIRTVPVSSQGGQVCLGQASAKMYDLSRVGVGVGGCPYNWGPNSVFPAIWVTRDA